MKDEVTRLVDQQVSLPVQSELRSKRFNIVLGELFANGLQTARVENGAFFALVK